MVSLYLNSPLYDVGYDVGKINTDFNKIKEILRIQLGLCNTSSSYPNFDISIKSKVFAFN